jgi:hypothetical protein
MCEFQLLYTHVTFRCLFETLVLLGVSGFWALCKNGLQMAVAMNSYHAYLSVTYSLLHGQASTPV